MDNEEQRMRLLEHIGNYDESITGNFLRLLNLVDIYRDPNALFSIYDDQKARELYNKVQTGEILTTTWRECCFSLIRITPSSSGNQAIVQYPPVIL